MKSLTSLLSLLFLTFITSVFAGNPVQFSPEHPTPGEKIKITYQVSETPLKDVDAFNGILYLLEGDMPVAHEIELTKSGDTYQGEFVTTPETKALFVLFQTPDLKQSDNNDDKGYYRKMYTKDGKSPAKGARQALADAYYGKSYYLNIKRDSDKAMKYLKKELAAYPEVKGDVSFVNFYSNLVIRSKDEDAQPEILAMAEALSKEKKSEEKLMAAHSIYTGLKKGEMAEKVEKKIRKKYPKGDFIKSEVYNGFFAARSEPEKMEAKFAELKKLSDLTNKTDKDRLANLASYLVTTYGRKEEMEKVDMYVVDCKDSKSLDNTYNSIAWDLSGGGIDAEAKNIELAEQYSKKSLELTQHFIDNPKENKPSHQTIHQFVTERKFTYGNTSDTYALVLYKQGKKDEALRYQEKALKMAAFVSPEMYERHGVYYEAVEGKNAAEELLASYIKDNKATVKMKTRHKELFLANNTLESAYEKNLAMLEAEAEKLFLNELKKKMINEEAPNFTLVNLDGETVKLSEMKGKVVILDFWATWCGPCKMSFPGMQKALNDFKNNDKVAFLFINSWEGGEGAEDKVTKFIKDNEYTFNVPMDKDDKVIKSYKVEGIPTKFIIGPNGRIRFKSVGYGGDNDALVKELKAMIKMANGKGGETTASLGVK